MDDYDKASRYAAKLDGAGFLRWLLGGGQWTFAHWSDTRTRPDRRSGSRTGDLIAFCDSPDGPLAAVVEFQAVNDDEVVERVQELVSHHQREARRAGRTVVGAVVNLTGPPQPAERSASWPGRPDVGSWFGVELRALRGRDAAGTLEQIAAEEVARCVLPWAVLMHGSAAPGTIGRWLGLAAGEPDGTARADYGALARVFARLLPLRDRFAWQRALEGYAVQRSEFMEELRNEGALLANRSAVLRFLQGRFRPRRLPAALRQAVESVNEPDRLNELIDAAAAADSLDDFRRRAGL